MKEKHEKDVKPRWQIRWDEVNFSIKSSSAPRSSEFEFFKSFFLQIKFLQFFSFCNFSTKFLINAHDQPQTSISNQISRTLLFVFTQKLSFLTAFSKTFFTLGKCH